MIRSTERSSVIYFFTLYLFIGIGLAIGRSTADALFFKRYGIEYLPVIYLLLSVVLMFFSTFYAAFSDRLSPEKMFRIIYGCIIVVLGGNWLFITFSGNSIAYPIYFLAYEAASELLLVHASLYLGKNLEVQQLKRISAVIFSGAQIGIIIGGLFLAGMSNIIGVPNMLLVWMTVISISSIMILVYHRRTGPSLFYRSPVKGKRIISQSINEIKQGLVFARRSPLLRTICYAMFFMVVSYFTLSYSVNRIYNATFTSEESLSAFFGILNAACSFAALMLQLFVTNRLLSRFGLKISNLIYPFTTLFSFGMLMFSYALPAALFGSFNKDTLTPAIRTPVRNIFFNALPDYMQGRARALAIALVMPLALIVTGLLLLLSQSIDQPDIFLVIGMLTALAYLFSHIRMNKTYINSIINVLSEKLYLPDKNFNASLIRNDPHLIAELNKGLQHNDPDISLSYAKLLIELDTNKVSEKILQRAINETDEVAALRLFKLLRYTDVSTIETELVDIIQQADGLLKYTLLTILLSHGTESVHQQGLNCLTSDNPTALIAGIVAARRFGSEEQQLSALKIWRELLNSDIELSISAGIEACKILNDAPSNSLQRALKHDNSEIRQRTLQFIHQGLNAPEITLCNSVVDLTSDPIANIRADAYCCLAAHWPETAQEKAEQALGDDHPNVRSAGIDILFDQSNEGLAVLKAWVIGNAGSPRAQRTAFESLAKRSNEPAMWQSIAHSRIEDARKFVHAYQILLTSESDISSKLMTHVVKERLHQTIELSLIAMAQFDNATSINIVRACLSGGERQHIAQASEILCNLDSQELAMKLADVIENAYSKENVENNERIFSSTADVLAWCKTRSDEWLSCCANHTATQTGIKV